MSLKGLWRREDGAVGVLAAVAFTMVVVLCGLVVDMGLAYIQSGKTQNAADASAQAAGTLLPVAVSDTAGQQRIRTFVEEYAVKNGMKEDSVQAVEFQNIVDGSYTGVRVSLSRDVAYHFGPIVGIQGTTVTKSAKVLLEPATSSTAVVPLGIDATSFAQMKQTGKTQNIVVKFGGGDGTEGFSRRAGSGWRQGRAAPEDFYTWLAFGYGGTLHVGDVLPVEPGNMAGPTNHVFCDPLQPMHPLWQ